MSDIFISYRREDSDAYAGRLYDRLSTRFDKARIFMDIDMDLGLDFVSEIDQRVGSCKVLVAVIGRSWLDVKDAEGRRRLADPNDWVRLEIVAALERNIPVIPALVGGAKMPAASDLPDPLSRLMRRQAIEITHSGFHSDVDRLIRGLEKILATEEKKIEKTVTRGKAESTRSVVEMSEPRQTVEVPEGVYFDPQTGLMWTIKDNGQDITSSEAKEYAEQLRLGGYSDWRVPSLDELGTLLVFKSDGKYAIRSPFQLSGRSVWSFDIRSLEFAVFKLHSGWPREEPATREPRIRALCVRGPVE